MNAAFPQSGEVFGGKYRIEQLLGQGGFSRVYHAIQTDLERHVALKILRPLIDEASSASEQFERLEALSLRFQLEAKTVSKLQSSHTITMYDYGETPEGFLYMVLEYVRGVSLAQLIRREGALAPRRVVRILLQVLDSLHEAHTMGILHRDLKPQNIMVLRPVGQ